MSPNIVLENAGNESDTKHIDVWGDHKPDLEEHIARNRVAADRFDWHVDSQRGSQSGRETRAA
jgi:ribosomal protein S16